MVEPELVPGVLPSTRTVHLTAPEVLDLHAGLQEVMAHPDARMLEALTRWATEEARDWPQWAASHLHPAVRADDLSPWLRSLGADLAGATTYQVTAEMTELAMRLAEITPDLATLAEEEIPCPWGFMWLDAPIPRPAEDDGDLDPEMLHAVSWARVPAMITTSSETGERATVPAMRIREWGYYPSQNPPLILMGQHMVVTGRIRGLKVNSPLPQVPVFHSLWILMGMEIVSTAEAPIPRAFRKRAYRNLKHQRVCVVQLRRSQHREPSGEHRKVDWSCCWLVRGHNRKAPNGGTFKNGRDTTWVKPFIKGPEGMPLKASDVLYRLSR